MLTSVGSLLLSVLSLLVKRFALADPVPESECFWMDLPKAARSHICSGLNDRPRGWDQSALEVEWSL